MKAGKLIVLYGINNLGKSTQAELLVEKLQKTGLQAAYLKYPLYDLEPSGPLINDYLRGGNPYNLSPREAQMLYIKNRTQYDPVLRQRLGDGEWIVAEDYVGTGISWGIGAGVERAFLEKLNSHLLTEDLAFHFMGDRFLEAREKEHKHESDDVFTETVRKAHNELAQDRGWHPIRANMTIEEIADAVWQHVVEKFDV